MAEPAGLYAYEGLDRIFHEKARLSIVTSLAGHGDGLGFSDLKSLCSLTDGNLSRHLQLLEEAGLVVLEKGYEGRRPHTRCKLTEEGLRRFGDYLTVLEQVLKKASQATSRETAAAPTFSEKPI